MGKRLKIVVWLVLLVFVVNQAPSSGQIRSVTLSYKSKDKGQVRAREALKLAKALVAVLPGILQQFRTRRGELADAGFPRAGVTTLLDATEASLQKEFKKRDFAPLRDHIADVFNQARGGLGLPTRTALLSSPRPQATLASLHLALFEEESALDHSLAERVLDGIEAFVADLSERATRNDLTVNLCVLSDPPKAKVSLHAKDGEEIDPTKTNDRFMNLFRGKYFYTVEKRSLSKLDGPLDLYPKKQPVLECAWDGGGCAVREGWSEACRGR
jgi:hypothetical protein